MAYILLATLCLHSGFNPMAKEQVWPAATKAGPSKCPSACQPPQYLPISKEKTFLYSCFLYSNVSTVSLMATTVNWASPLTQSSCNALLGTSTTYPCLPNIPETVQQLW